jgi:hypothetical protein
MPGTFNASGKWLHLTPDEEVTDAFPPPDGSTVLAAPGGTVPTDIVARYDLAERLEGEHQPPSMTATGEPIIHVGDRAFAASVVPSHLQPKEMKDKGLIPKNQSTSEQVRVEMARQRAMAEDEEDVEEDDPDEPGKKRTVRRKKSASKSHSHSHGHAHTKAVHKSDTEDK